MTTKVTETKLAKIKPDQTNANRHTERGEGMIRQSIHKYGFAEAGTLDKDNNVIGGNLRTEASTDLGMDDAIIVDVDGTKPVYLRRNDLSLTDPNDTRARELAYALNRVAQVSIDFDPGQVLADLNADIDLSGLFSDIELQDILMETNNQGPPNLDDLENQYGDPQERDFWPVIKVQVSPETHELYQSFLEQLPGEDEGNKMEQILKVVDASLLESRISN